MKTHFTFTTRVYYEDTDAAGIVYYANYLKFAERARTEWLREIGISQEQLRQESGLGFVVRRVESDFIAPATLDDLLTIETRLEDIRRVRLRMQQTIRRDTKILVQLKVDLACVNAQIKPSPLPEALMKYVNTNIETSL